ncbi:L-histidine N(alpha)-methyltransferase [Pirellulimonas nuda]|uniref:L-histidine N(alpha)-methyltransferase n=1 Tax=Pirellulimonas nuda TaxID=2528009 RepID=UPI001E5FF862|nr:L-histidine N(alpha)-methyltransferase [Pirellulimonas nuda]
MSSTLSALVAPPPSRAAAAFRRDVLTGLSSRAKHIHCKYLYDRPGSLLFDKICELPEYYPTRTERAILTRHAASIARQIGPRAALVEYGSGSSVKSRLLLDAMIDPIAYVPVDISLRHLEASAAGIARAYPAVDVLPVCADFSQGFSLPDFPRPPSHSAVFFPGSTIGNFLPDAARGLLSGIARLVGVGGGLVIGFDLQKDPRVIEAAYNDREGVTAAFNLNLLHRINRELDGRFEVDRFAHRAVYQDAQGRVSISLVSRQRQTVEIGDASIAFEAGESIHTEYSHKYTLPQFEAMAASAGMGVHRVWTDPKQWFAVAHCVVERPS